MGNDGGSIPGRKDLVKEKEKEKRTENNELVKQSQSKYCAISKEPLKKPVVGDMLGLLYNKEMLIQALIERRLPNTFLHISSLKDVRDLNITLSDENTVGKEVKILCPITMIEFSGLNMFYLIWSCGCVLSKKAIEELNMKDKCVNCGSVLNHNKSDLISLNYSTKERQELFNRIVEEKIKMKEKKMQEKNEKKLNRKREKDSENIKDIKESKNQHKIKKMDVTDLKNFSDDLKPENSSNLKKVKEINKGEDFFNKSNNKKRRIDSA